MEMNMRAKLVSIGGKTFRVTSSGDYDQYVDWAGRIVMISHRDGTILFKSEDFKILEKFGTELAKYPTKWDKVEGAKFILTRVNCRTPLYYWEGQELKYYPEYKCEKCNYIKKQISTIKDHLRRKHELYQKEPDYTTPPHCHACGYKYKIKKNPHYNFYIHSRAYEKERNKHHETCEKIKERLNKYVPSGGYIDYDATFDILGLEFYTKLLIGESFTRRYISQKHINLECQPQYIDKYTTAYRSEIMQSIMDHRR